MTALNRLQLIGNVGAEPKVAMSKQNTEFVTLSLATNERVCRNDEWSTLTEWHNLVFFGKACEIAKKFKKGDQLYVEGKIRSNKWTDSEGVSRITTQGSHYLVKDLVHPWTKSTRQRAKCFCPDRPASGTLR